MIFGSGAGENTRFAWNSKNPKLERFFSGKYPAYLHCQLRICFKDDQYTNSANVNDTILCPEICDRGDLDPNHPTLNGRPDSKWFENIGYNPLTLHTIGGPYFLSSTHAVDLTRIREVKESFGTNRKSSFVVVGYSIQLMLYGIRNESMAHTVWHISSVTYVTYVTYDMSIFAILRIQNIWPPIRIT